MKGLPQPAVGGTNQTNAEVEDAVEEVGAWFELVPACPYPPKESIRRFATGERHDVYRTGELFVHTGELLCI